MAEDSTARRKDAHLDLCATAEVEPLQNSTLLDCVHLLHCAMPEMALEDVALETQLFGKTLKVPLVITGMTGGTDRAGQVNRDLASLAEKHGLAFGLGSQRAMADDLAALRTYDVRDVAPSVLLFGNIGLRQAAAMGTSGVLRLKDAIRADAVALHLNPAQELTQPEGDRDFRGGYAMVESLAQALQGRLLVKETGCGLSPAVARRLVDMGVSVLDVSGAGGTSWVRVEQLRARGGAAEVGAQFSGWGIPTGAAVAAVRAAVGAEVKVIASGGVRTGLDIARAIVLGADAGGMALPLFRAQQEGGFKGAEAALDIVVAGLKQALLLTGSRTVDALKRSPRVIVGELKDWLAALEEKSWRR